MSGVFGAPEHERGDLEGGTIDARRPRAGFPIDALRMSAYVKGFRMPARHRRVSVHGGRRPKTLEGGNRGGSSRRRWCRSMGNLSPLLDLICGFRTGRRLSDRRALGLGAVDGIGAVIWCLVLQVCRPKVAPTVAVGEAWALPVR